MPTVQSANRPLLIVRLICVGLILVALGTTATAQDLSFTRPPKQTTPKEFSKCASSIYRLYTDYKSGKSRNSLASNSISPEDALEDSVRVVCEMTHRATGSDSLSLSMLGGRVEAMAENLIQIVFPLDRLSEFESADGVRHVRFPYRPVPQEVISEGLSDNVIGGIECTGASTSGQGIKVAILDGGFSGYNALLGSELPSSVTVKSYRSDGDIYAGTNHGTACAEIIHDIAPGAQLYLVNTGTDVEFHNAVEYLIAQGVNVVNFSVGWPGQFSIDGLSDVSSKVDYAKAHGIAWCNSAGNYAKQHWSGFFSDPDLDSYHNFAGVDETDSVYLTAGTPYNFRLMWNNWPVTAQDYDLYLYDSYLFEVAYSIGVQTGTQPPTEAISYTPSVSGVYHLVIKRYSGSSPVRLHIYSLAADLEYRDPARSMSAPADAFGALTSGAVDWYYRSTIESFSSQGPTDDGRTKPDLVGPDGVSTASKGFWGFLGTSAASPHTAGVAALVLSQHPAWTPQIVIDSLKKWAVDKGAGGLDNVFGAGLLQVHCVPSQFTISGYVRLSGGAGVSGVVMSGLTGNPSTDAAGLYTATVTSGWSGTVTPTHSCYTFSPTNKVYSNVTAAKANENYTATVKSFQISGSVKTSGAVAIAGVTMSDLPGSPVTGANGLYTATVDCGWTGTATPTKAGYTFSPASRSHTNVTANQINQNFTGTATALTISGYVRTSGAVGIPGVVLSGLPGNPSTDAAGLYTASIPSGWSGTATPTKAGYTFSPTSRTHTNVTASQANQNFTGTVSTLTIAGYLRTSGGIGIPSVVMNGLPGTPSSNGAGFYTASVPFGWSGTSTPSHGCYTFSPVSKSYTNVIASTSNEDFAATIKTFQVSGFVGTSTAEGIPGVTISGLPGAPVTDVNGLYTATVDCGWSGTATPSMVGFAFSPASRTHTNVTASQTNQNFTGTSQNLILSGYVSTGEGIWAFGVVMNGLPGNPSTDASGFYTASIPNGWSGTVTPTHDCYTLLPLSRVYSSVTSSTSSENYTATLRTFYISGYVRTSGAVGIPGVTMSGSPSAPVTDANGLYTATVDCGWTGTATPTRAGYTFSPLSRTHTDVTSSQANQDFTGTLQSLTISGHVTSSSGSGIGGVALSGLPTPPSTDASGFYTASVPYNWIGTVTPNLSCYEFIPASYSYDAVASDQGSQDFTANQLTFTVSGRVANRNNIGVGGVTVTGLPGNPVTLADGSYSASVPCAWIGSASPAVTGGTCIPPQSSYDAIYASIANQDYVINHYPQFNTMNSATISEGEQLSTPISGSDPDGDALTIGASGVPEHAQFTDHGDGTATINFSPDFDQSGWYALNLTISDGDLIAQGVLNVTVNNTNRPPNQFTLGAPAQDELIRSKSATLRWNRTIDPDPGEPVTYTLFVIPRPSGWGADSLSVGADSSKSISSLLESTEYAWHVFAQDPYGARTDNTGGARQFRIDDLTPPILSIGVLQNPIFATELDIYVLSNEPLSTPPSLTVNSISYSVSPNVGLQQSYSSNYTIAAPVVLNLTAIGQDASTNMTDTSETFEAFPIGSGNSAISTIDGYLRLVIPQGAIDKNRVLIVDDCSATDAVTYALAPAGLEFNRPIELRIACPDESQYGCPCEQLAMYTQDRLGEWTPLPTFYDDRSKTLISDIDRFGTIQLRQRESGASAQLPMSTRIELNYPNPFNAQTTIEFTLEKPSRARIDVYNILGQLVTTIVDAEYTRGTHRVGWDARDASGRLIASGLYLCRLSSEKHESTRKLLLIK